MYDYLVVGAGIFGAVFAERMTARGKTCLVLDKRENIGGNVFTKEIEGINVHMFGAHIFHTNNDKVWNYINEFATFNNYRHCPIASYCGHIYNLPFNMNTFSQMWGISFPREAMAIIDKQRRETGITFPRNLEEQALFLVGTDIYKILIKEYTEKQWGRKCSELPSFIIKRLPVRFTFDNNYFSDSHQGIPIGGYTNIIKKMLAKSEVRLNTNYKDFVKQNGEVATTTVFTGKIDEFFDYRLGALEYRSLRFENSILNTENFQGSSVVNYTDAVTPFTRIIEHKHFENADTIKTVITKEFSLSANNNLEPYYPINDDKNNNLFLAYQKLAKDTKNVVFGGRLGEYKYYDMDKTIERALELVGQFSNDI